MTPQRPATRPGAGFRGAGCSGEKLKSNIMKAKTKSLCITAAGKISKNIQYAIRNCRLDVANNKIYTGYYTGSGRFTSAASSDHTIVSILRAQGYKFTRGNDAPRGGALGDYVKISRTAFNFIATLK